MKKEDFFTPDFVPVFSSALHCDKLQKIDCLVLGAIYWYERLRDGKCTASNASIARIVGAKSVTVISNCLKSLEDNGFIVTKYKDDSKRHREQISCVIDRCIKKTMCHPQMNQDLFTDDSVESSTDEQRENIIEKKINKKEIDSLIESFSTIDPKNKTNYGNKTERAACDFLLKEYGQELIESVIKILPKTNKMDYMPHISKPSELKDKWLKLKDAIEKKKSNFTKSNANIAF